MLVKSRSLAAISCSIGVNRKKFSRLTTVTSKRESFRFSNSSAAYSPPNPPPRISTRVFLSLMRERYVRGELVRLVTRLGRDIRLGCEAGRRRQSQKRGRDQSFRGAGRGAGENVC